MDGNFETPEQKLEKIREEINAAKAVSDGRVASEADEAAENGGAYDCAAEQSPSDRSAEEPNKGETETVDGSAETDTANGYGEAKTEPLPRPAYNQPQVRFTAPQREKKSGKAAFAVMITLTAVSLAVAILSSCIALLAYKRAENAPRGNVEIKQSNDDPPREEKTEENGTAGAAIAKVLPSTVEIITLKASGSGGGSGVIMSEDGYILTNAHVIDSAKSVRVRDNEDNYYYATVIGYDSESDVGVIKIEGTFTPAEFADSETVKVGDTVIAIGTPFDSVLFQTATKGMVSAVRNTVTFENLGITADVIQHDATINSGNSGGPLINLNGEVVGLNSVQIAGEYNDLGFALRINTVLNYAKQIIETGDVEKPMLGVTVKADADGGLWVGALTEGGAAEKAGVKVGDVIKAADGKEVEDVSDLSAYLKTKRVGDEIELTIERDGETLTVTAVLKSSKDG